MTTSPLVRGYLDELRSTADGRIGTTRAAELVDEIHEHIDAAIQSGQSAEQVIDRLGSPAEIVAAEAPVVPASPPAFPPTGPRLRTREALAIALLLVGVVVAVVGWFVGVVLLWTSDRWSSRDKLIGTLLWPGGLGLLLTLGGFAGTSSEQTCDSTGACSTITATTGPPTWAGITLAVVLAVVPVLTSIHLARSARVPQAA